MCSAGGRGWGGRAAVVRLRNGLILLSPGVVLLPWFFSPLNKPPQPVPMHCVLYIVPSSPPFLLLPVPRHVSTHPNAFTCYLPARHRRRHRRQADQSSSPGILPGPRRCPSSRLATQTVCAWMGYRGPHGR